MVLELTMRGSVVAPVHAAATLIRSHALACFDPLTRAQAKCFGVIPQVIDSEVLVKTLQVGVFDSLLEGYLVPR